MKKLATVALSLAATVALTAMPLASASARDWDHHGGGGHYDRGYHGGYHDHYRGRGPVYGVGATLAAVVTAPFAIFGALTAPPPPPVRVVTPVAYAAPVYPGYVYARQRVVYAQPYYAPAPVYAPY